MIWGNRKMWNQIWLISNFSGVIHFFCALIGVHSGVCRMAKINPLEVRRKKAAHSFKHLHGLSENRVEKSRGKWIALNEGLLLLIRGHERKVTILVLHQSTFKSAGCNSIHYFFSEKLTQFAGTGKLFANLLHFYPFRVAFPSRWNFRFKGWK